jgi:DNA-binding transcriptional regulator YdaS (Cro superfamily)
MQLHEYLSKEGTQAKLATDLGISPAQVWQWKKGLRPVPVELCSGIEKATSGEVTRKELRPDDWQEIWPELVKAKAKATA